MSKQPQRPPNPKPPDERPLPGKRGPRTPYPVDRPDIEHLPGAEPDVVSDNPQQLPGRM